MLTNNELKEFIKTIISVSEYKRDTDKEIIIKLVRVFIQRYLKKKYYIDTDINEKNYFIDKMVLYVLKNHKYFLKFKNSNDLNNRLAFTVDSYIKQKTEPKNNTSKTNVIKRVTSKELKSWKDKFFNTFSDYYEADIIASLVSISETNKEHYSIIVSYFGLFNIKRLSSSEIVKIHKLKTDIELEEIVNSNINIIKENLNKNSEKKQGSSKAKADKKNNIDDFIKAFPNFTKKQVLDAVAKLPENDRLIIELHYGLKDEWTLSIKELSEKFNTSIEAINNQINTAKQNIEETLNQKKETNSTKTPNDLFNIFPGFSKEEILNAINELSDLNRSTLEFYYGLNGHEALRLKELSQKFETNTNSMNARLYFSRKKIQKILSSPPTSINEHKIVGNNTAENKSARTPDDLFEEFPGFSKEDILNAINKLSDLNRSTLEFYYALNGNKPLTPIQIAGKFNTAKTTIYSRLSFAKRKIKQILNPISKVNKIESLFTLFPNFSKEDILESINELSDNERISIELFYGLNGRDVHTVKEITQLLDVTATKVSTRLYLGKKSIDRILNPKSKVNKTESLFTLFSNFSKEDILAVLSTIPNKYKIPIELCYGLNSNEVHSISQIAEKLGSEKSAIRYEINYAKNLIKKALIKDPKPSIEDKFFALFPDFSKEESLSAIDKLSDNLKKTLELYYGLNGKEALSIKDIANKFSTSTNTVYSRIRWSKQYIKKILSDQTPLPVIEEKSNAINSITDDISVHEEDKFLALFPGFSKEEALTALDELSPKRKLVIELRHGLNGQCKSTNNEIAEALGYRPAEIKKRYNYAITLVKKQLKSEISEKNFEPEQIEILEKPQEEKSLVIINPESKNLLVQQISSLEDPNESIFLLLHLGVKGKSFTEEELGKAFEISQEEVHATIYNGLSKVYTSLDEKINNGKTAETLQNNIKMLLNK